MAAPRRGMAPPVSAPEAPEEAQQAAASAADVVAGKTGVEEAAAVVAPAKRRRLQKWDGRRPVGVIPRPVPGKGPEGEEIAATTCSQHPMALALMSQEGWTPAQAGTGEIENEEDYQIADDGTLQWGDTVVVIRDGEYHKEILALEKAAIERRSLEIGLPKVTMEQDTEVRTLAQKLERGEGPGDD